MRQLYRPTLAQALARSSIRAVVEDGFARVNRTVLDTRVRTESMRAWPRQVLIFMRIGDFAETPSWIPDP